MSSTLGLTVLPEYESLAYDERQGSFVVLLRPPMAPQTRPPLRLVLAIDVSGSMLGDKLTTALASAQAILNALSPADTFACVTFNGKAQVLLPMTTMNAQGKQLAAQALRAAQARGNTNLGDAILSSFELCGGRGRALLLTDGCPTEGVTSPDQLAQLTRSTARGATLSTFGFGRDVNPLLLSSLSEQGSGNYTFIEAGEPPIEAIAAEVGGLLMTTAANLRLLFRPSPGVTIDQVFRASDVQLHDGAVSLGLAALVAEEDVSLPLSLRWDEAALGGTLATLSAQAYDVATGELLSSQEILLPRFTSARGALRPDAARELLLGRAAMALRSASHASGRPGAELAREVSALRGELTSYAALARIDDEPQVVAALAMLDDACKGLLARGEAQRTARQDMVATSAALSKKRSTMMGMKDASQLSSQKAFTSRSQLAGIDFIKKNQDNDD
jgi:uncharacterized protein YegL